MTLSVQDAADDSVVNGLDLRPYASHLMIAGIEPVHDRRIRATRCSA
jgi:hypothetical protein